KQEIGIPIHFHTHDTAGMQAGSILEAAEEKLDIADGAMAAMSGGTSQPNLNAIVEALRFTERDSGLDGEKLGALSDYWQAVREFYLPFDSNLLPAPPNSTATRCPAGST